MVVVSSPHTPYLSRRRVALLYRRPPLRAAMASHRMAERALRLSVPRGDTARPGRLRRRRPASASRPISSPRPVAQPPPWSQQSAAAPTRNVPSQQRHKAAPFATGSRCRVPKVATPPKSSSQLPVRHAVVTSLRRRVLPLRVRPSLHRWRRWAMTCRLLMFLDDVLLRGAATPKVARRRRSSRPRPHPSQAPPDRAHGGESLRSQMADPRRCIPLR